MSQVKNKVKWCLNKAEREIGEGRKHRGLIKVEPDLDKAKNHIEKAEHNLRVTLYLRKGDFTDWCSVTIFYAIYHCFLSILIKFGYESRNQECTFALIRSLIEDGLIDLEKEYMNKISSLDIEEKQDSPKSVVNIREEYQYTTELSLEDETLDELLDLSRKILDKTKTLIEE